MDEESVGSPAEVKPPFSDVVLAAIYGDAAAVAVAVIALSAGQLIEYGWTMFCVMPVITGFVSGYYLRTRNHSVANVLYCSLFALGIPSAVLLAVQWEGIVCVVMALPIGLMAHFLFALIGGAIAGRARGSQIRISFLVLAPFICASEAHLSMAPSHHKVSTWIIVNAPAEKIWPLLSNLDSISPTKNVLFLNGVAHPLSIHTVGSGVGAKRSCNLTTGEMPERVSQWEPNKRLVFEVVSTPASMKELNPFGPVHAAHLTGYYVCEQGSFELIPLGSNRTRIIGTSKYQHHFGPSWYWTLWTNYIVHSVHSSVLEEIKARAEEKA